MILLILVRKTSKSKEQVSVGLKSPTKQKQTKNKKLAKFTKEITTKTVSQEVNKPLTL